MQKRSDPDPTSRKYRDRYFAAQELAVRAYCDFFGFSRACRYRPCRRARGCRGDEIDCVVTRRDGKFHRFDAARAHMRARIPKDAGAPERHAWMTTLHRDLGKVAQTTIQFNSIGSWSGICSAHDLIRKPVSTFRDHASGKRTHERGAPSRPARSCNRRRRHSPSAGAPRTRLHLRLHADAFMVCSILRGVPCSSVLSSLSLRWCCWPARHAPNH